MNTKLNSTCIEKECEITNREAKILYSFFINSLEQPGYSKTFSLLTLDNIKSLQYVVRVIDENAPSLEKVPRFKEYSDECEKLLQRFADRDEQGTVKRTADGGFEITEQYVEYNEEKAKLDETYMDVVQRIAQDENLQDFYLEEKIKVILVIPDDFENCPETLPPVIISILEKLY
jgi:hypothetical protein